MMALFTFQDIPTAEASGATSIATIKAQMLAIIAEITANPKPNYSIDGQSISWSDYLGQLQRSVEWCNQQLAVDEPFEIVSRGYCQ